MVVDWSTDSIAPRLRFDEWREACCRHVYALTPERRQREPFNGALRRRRIGPLDVVDIRCDGHVVQRRPEDIRAQPSANCYLYVQLEGSAWFDQAGRRQHVQAGDIVIADPNVAFSTGALGRFDFRLWQLERARLAPRMGRGEGALPMVTLHAARGDGTLVAEWLDMLLRRAAGLHGPSLEAACDTLCALVADFAGLAPQAHDRGRDARRAARLQQAVRYLERRACDPALDAKRAASDLAMSVRALHQLFEGADATFHDQVNRVRLERAHAMLVDPACRSLSAAEIGLAAGFSEPSTFYRRFRQRYGTTPGELRGQPATRLPG
jgi:AraC-like DNA-binding protein